MGGTLAILNATNNSSIPSGSQVEAGTVIQIVATADNGYQLDSIKVNGAVTAKRSVRTAALAVGSGQPTGRRERQRTISDSFARISFWFSDNNAGE